MYFYNSNLNMSLFTIVHVIKFDQSACEHPILKEILTELKIIKLQNQKIMSNTDTALAQLQDLATQLGTLKTEVDALIAASQAAPDTPQSVLDAIAKVKTAADAIQSDVAPASPTTAPPADTAEAPAQ